MASRDELNRLLTLIPTLSKSDLKTIRTRVDFNLRGKVPDTEDWLLRGILVELNRRGLDGRPFHIKNNTSYASFNTQSENVRSLLLSLAPNITVVQQMSLGEIAGFELASYISEWTDVDRTTMLQFVSRVPEAIDKAFPGYMAAGLLSLLVAPSNTKKVIQLVT